MIIKIVDFTLALLLLVVLSPLFAIVAIGLLCSLGRPILFKQRRPGFKSKPFTVYKFRSMKDATDHLGKPLSDAKRLTALGRWMRRYSVDELPQLWNVLKGDMSLVGPRPLLMEYLPFYTQEDLRRHDVLPGITGWAQVNGRNTVSWKEKFAMDVWYVDHCSLRLNIKILLMTFGKVFSCEGVNQPGQATFEKFEGHES